MNQYPGSGLLLSPRPRLQHLPFVVCERPRATQLSDDTGLHARRPNPHRQLLDYLLRDRVLRQAVHLVRMHDVDVVPRPHHDVYPGRPCNPRQSKRVPALARPER